MHYLIDLLVWIFPGLADSLDRYRSSLSPVHLVVAVILGAAGILCILLAFDAL